MDNLHIWIKQHSELYQNFLKNDDNIQSIIILDEFILDNLTVLNDDELVKVLKCFQDDLEGYDVDESRFPRNSEDLVGLQREKKMWAQLWPDHYGIRQLVENDDLNKLFNDRYQAQVEMMFAEQNFELLTNQILQKVKQAGLDKYCEILGTENRMSWIKNGQIRFYKINEKNRGKNA